MVKALTFWSLIVGFIIGLAYSVGQNLVDDIKNPDVDAFYSLNYVAFVVVIIIAIFLGWLFYYLEKQENERREHNEDIQFKSLVNNLEKIDKSINSLADEIRQDRNERKHRK